MDISKSARQSQDGGTSSMDPSPKKSGTFDNGQQSFRTEYESVPSKLVKGNNLSMPTNKRESGTSPTSRLNQKEKMPPVISSEMVPGEHEILS